MKTTLRKVFVILIVAFTALVLFFSILKVDPNSICVIRDLRTGEMVKIVRPVVGNYSIAWQGVFPWWFIVYEVPARRVVEFNAVIVITGLEESKKERYHVNIPVRMKYRIDTEQFTDAGKMAENGRGIDELVGRYIEAQLQREMARFLAPVYQPEAIAADVEPAVARARSAIAADLAALGIRIDDVKLPGTAFIPDRALHLEGLQHAANLRVIDNMLEKDIIEARNRVVHEKIISEQFYERLKKISRLIKANPDILKYIYIDKMAGNVKLILSPDSTGVPQMLELEKGKPSKKVQSREIDNLK